MPTRLGTIRALRAGRQAIPGAVNEIKVILFDIGGVLVELDGLPSLAALLGAEQDHETLHAIWMASPAVVAHETGKIGASEFAAGVVADLKLPVTADLFLRDFCSWPKGLLSGALELLDEIPDLYRLSALSNTSAAHWERIVALGVADRFEQAFLSHQTGYLKPAAEAFQVAISGMGVSPSEVLFLDDGLRNIKVARTLGIDAHLARGPQDARRVLAYYGVLPSNGA